DGELVAIASREGATQAVVVDLRSRSMRGVLHYGSGWPRLAFSLDGQRIFAAGMNNASTLNGWRVPADDMPKIPRWWGLGKFSLSGARYILWNPRSGRFEVHRSEDGLLLASGVRSFGLFVRLLREAIVAYVAVDFTAVTIVDLETDRVLWNQPCRVCFDISVSEDDSRLAQVGANGLEVWDTRLGQRLFQETQRARPYLTQCTISRDGRRVAWTVADGLFVRDLDSGRELTFPLDGA